MKPEERMNVLFDDFESRLSVYVYEGNVSEKWRQVQLFIGESKYGFKVWVYAVDSGKGLLFKVMATVAGGKPYSVSGVGVQRISSARTIFLSPESKVKPPAGSCAVFSLQNDASHAMDVVFDIYIAPILFDSKLIQEQYFKKQ